MLCVKVTISVQILRKRPLVDWLYIYFVYARSMLVFISFLPLFIDVRFHGQINEFDFFEAISKMQISSQILILCYFSFIAQQSSKSLKTHFCFSRIVSFLFHNLKDYYNPVVVHKMSFQLLCKIFKNTRFKHKFIVITEMLRNGR